MDGAAIVRTVEKLRAGGERGRAISLAVEAGLKPEDVPFLDGYAEHLALSAPPAVEREGDPAEPPKRGKASK